MTATLEAVAQSALELARMCWGRPCKNQLQLGRESPDELITRVTADLHPQIVARFNQVALQNQKHIDMYGDSASANKSESGRYTPERTRLHKQIVDSMLATKKNRSMKKTIEKLIRAAALLAEIGPRKVEPFRLLEDDDGVGSDDDQYPSEPAPGREDRWGDLIVVPVP